MHTGMTAGRILRTDIPLALALMALSVLLTRLGDNGRPPDTLGWVLMMCGQASVALRRLHPTAAVVILVVFIGPYHALGYNHIAPTLAAMLVLYGFATTAPPLRAWTVGTIVIAGTVAADWIAGSGDALETLRVSGWIAFVVATGVFMRAHRERADRAERTREEVAARRVAEERLRIARDLHDILSHSITLIGVQASVAAHVLNVDPARMDRRALAAALDDIAESCRTARSDVRAALEFLRDSDGPDRAEPVPDLSALPALAARSGADLVLDVDEIRLRPSLQAAIYRIVQEALTNTTRHGGPAARATIRVTGREPDTVELDVTDDGRAAGDTSGSRLGLVGMTERARSVGGTLTAGPRPEGGFRVHARFPAEKAP
ncbi:sensor histidine kinase [Herbidospora mongoliensis]|uniref:sensor histidine kinase n=1 Tax=Herbidospora mongoliensis TaxID=688067 RepID=UPI00082B306B|nr:histidine kinase [Herbidospora mongoliensis]